MADTDIDAGRALAARRKATGRNGAATMAQPQAAIPNNKMMEVAALAGGLA